MLKVFLDQNLKFKKAIWAQIFPTQAWRWWRLKGFSLFSLSLIFIVGVLRCYVFLSI